MRTEIAVGSLEDLTVIRTQTHRAIVTDTTTYVLRGYKREEFLALSEEDRETFLVMEGVETESNIVIDEIVETVASSLDVRD